MRRNFYVEASPPHRLLCLILTLVLLVRILPIGAFADSMSTEEVDSLIDSLRDNVQNNPGMLEGYSYDDYIATIKLFVDDFLAENLDGDSLNYLYAQLDALAADLYGLNDKEEIPEDVLKDLVKKKLPPVIPHVHAWSPFFNRTHHFLECTSGCDERKSVSKHNRDGENGNCTCGYVYLSNCGLTTLYFTDMTLSPAFDPEVTEYTATPVHYKDVEKTWITAFKFDELSTVEIPEDRTVEAGKQFQIKVTAEDLKTTRTYTVTVAE